MFKVAAAAAMVQVGLVWTGTANHFLFGLQLAGLGWAGKE